MLAPFTARTSVIAISSFQTREVSRELGERAASVEGVLHGGYGDCGKYT